MVNKKRRLFIDFKENFQKKTRLIEDLKILISNDLNLKDKEDYVLDIRNLAYYVQKGLEVTKV